jgi:hypothetical protein
MYERYLEHQASHTDYALINKNWILIFKKALQIAWPFVIINK